MSTEPQPPDKTGTPITTNMVGFFASNFNFSFFELICSPKRDETLGGNVICLLNDLRSVNSPNVKSTAGDAVMWVTMYQLERRMRSLYGETYQDLPGDLYCMAPELVYPSSKRSLVRTICSLVEYHTRLQGRCPFWTHLRIGRVTASSGFNNVSCKHRYGRHVSMMDDGKCAEERKAAILNVIDDKFIRHSPDTGYGDEPDDDKPYVSSKSEAYMKRGLDQEAIHADILRYLDPLGHGDYAVSGMLLCPDMMLLGASPDLVARNGIIELKSLPSLSIDSRLMKETDTGPTASQALTYIEICRRTGSGSREDLFVIDERQQNTNLSVYTFDRHKPLDANTGAFNVTDRLVRQSTRLRFNHRHRYMKQLLVQRYIITQQRALFDDGMCGKDIEQGSSMKWVDCGISFLVTYEHDYIQYGGIEVNKPAFLMVFDAKDAGMIEIVETFAEYKNTSSMVIENLVSLERP